MEKKDAMDEYVKKSESYNRDKVFEEIAEFQEVVVKLKTKPDGDPKKPEKIQLIKEFGDLMYRGFIYLRQQFPELSHEELVEKIDTHITKKLSKE